MLSVNNLVGFGAGGAPFFMETLSGTYSSTTDASSYTWSSADIGDRSQTIICIVYTNNAATGSDAVDELTGVTIDGVSTTYIRSGSTGSSGDGRTVVYWGIADTTSSTGDVVASFSGNQRHCYMYAFGANNYSGVRKRVADADSTYSSGDTATKTMSAYEEDGTYAVAVAWRNSVSNTPTFTSTGWTTVHSNTNDYNVMFEMYFRSDEADPITVTVTSVAAGRHRVEIVALE